MKLYQFQKDKAILIATDFLKHGHTARTIYCGEGKVVIMGEVARLMRNKDLLRKKYNKLQKKLKEERGDE